MTLSRSHSIQSSPKIEEEFTKILFRIIDDKLQERHKDKFGSSVTFLPSSYYHVKVKCDESSIIALPGGTQV